MIFTPVRICSVKSGVNTSTPLLHQFSFHKVSTPTCPSQFLVQLLLGSLSNMRSSSSRNGLIVHNSRIPWCTRISVFLTNIDVSFGLCLKVPLLLRGMTTMNRVRKRIEDIRQGGHSEGLEMYSQCDPLES